MGVKPGTSKPVKIQVRTDYTESDIKRDMKLSGATIFSFSSTMDLSIDKSEPKHEKEKKCL